MMAALESIPVSATPTPPIPPTSDPFYTSPLSATELAARALGAVLRVRRAPGDLSTVFGAACRAAAYNVVYRTTDATESASWAVTTVLLPAAPAPAPAVLVSYQIPYDSASPDASPSHAVYDPHMAFFMRDIPACLARGWCVAVPDYEGPLASFTSGPTSGYATLDGVRAILVLAATPTTTTATTTTTDSAIASMAADLAPLAATALPPKLLMWGYSGGAIATEWAVELLPSYASSPLPSPLSFAAVAVGGLEPVVRTVLTAASGGPFAGLLPSGLLGMTTSAVPGGPAARAWLESRLVQEGGRKDKFLAAKGMAHPQALQAFGGEDIGDYFVGGEGDILAPPVLAVMEQGGVMGKRLAALDEEARKMIPPLFVYKAVADEVSPVQDTDALVKLYQEAGANVTYRRSETGKHIDEFIAGQQFVLEWFVKMLQ